MYTATSYVVGPHMHHQPSRLVRGSPRRSTLSPDRLHGIDGLGQLGASDDEMIGVDESQYGYLGDKQLENDTDYASLVKTIVSAAGAITPAALALATQLSQKKGLDLQSILGLAQGRSAAVQNGTSSMPSGSTLMYIGLGVGALAILMMAMKK